MNDLLIIYPYDPNGTISVNFIKEEMHKLTASQGEDYAFLNLRKGPFHEKDLTIVDQRTRKKLILNEDYKLILPFINDGSRKDCFQIVEILNKSYFDSILLADYRTLGSDLVFDELEIMQYLATREINPREILWSEIVEKPGRYNPEEHLHHIKDFFGMNELVDALYKRVDILKVQYQSLVDSVAAHILEPNAHNITLIDLRLQRLANLYPSELSYFAKTNLTVVEKLSYLTPRVLNDFLDQSYLHIRELVKVHLEGPKQVTQASVATWRITNYDSFSRYLIESEVGTFTRSDEFIYGEFYVTDGLGKKTFSVIKDDVPTEFIIEIKEAGIETPLIAGISNNARDVALSAKFNSSTLRTTPANKDVLVECVYQISTDPTFSDIIFFSNVNSTDEVQTAKLSKLTTYYIRCKHEGTIYSSQWSPTVKFTTVDIAVPSVVFNPRTTIVSGGRLAHDFVAGASVFADYANERILSGVEYKLLLAVPNSTARPIVAYSGVKSIDFEDVVQSLAWTPLSSSDNGEYGQYGPDGYNTENKHFEQETFYELVCRIRLGNDDWSDWSNPKSIKTSKVTNKVVQESETVGEGDSAYLRYYDKEIQIYS